MRRNEGGLTDTQVPALIEAGAALRAPAVHGPHASSVRRLVADPAHTNAQRDQNEDESSPSHLDNKRKSKMADASPYERCHLEAESAQKWCWSRAEQNSGVNQDVSPRF